MAEKGLASWPGGHFIISVFTGSQPAAVVEKDSFYLLLLHFLQNIRLYISIFRYILPDLLYLYNYLCLGKSRERELEQERRGGACSLAHSSQNPASIV